METKQDLGFSATPTRHMIESPTHTGKGEFEPLLKRSTTCTERTYAWLQNDETYCT